jgi:hypothetical protein
VTKQNMRKFMITALSLGVILYLFLADVGQPVDEPPLDVAATQPETESSIRPADLPQKYNSSLSGNLGKPAEADPSSPLRSPAKAIAGNGYVDPEKNGQKVAANADPDQHSVVLRRLAEDNIAQIYAVVWQTLEDGGLDDVDFHNFVLATLDEWGHDNPGEVLAALVKTAPTPALRKSALRLLSEASQELSLDSFNRALDDPDPAIRQTALAFFDEMNANALLDAVTDAVLDRNRDVRLLAFSTMEDMYKFIPVWEAADRVVDDPDPQIRKRALELLTYGDRQIAIDRLELALGDPNPEINELAEALLEELEQVSS